MNRTIEFRIILMIAITSLLLAGCEKHSGLPRDSDGNEYDTVVIGTQVWLAENLKTTKYNNGVSIPLVTDNTEWVSMTTAAFCWYDNDPENKNIYGGLYNWYAVNTKLLCPFGWHVATEDEWDILIEYLGGDGSKIKSTEYWPNNECATNSTGFNARPGGGRSPIDGSFNNLGIATGWWVSTTTPYPESTTLIEVWDQTCGIEKKGAKYSGGSSVRCIKDN